MKALEKDRQRRYTTAYGLAQDLGRFLHHEPVLARPPTAAYRLGKFVRRHRTSVGVAAALLVLLIAFATAMAVQAERIVSERDHKEQALAEAEAVTGFLSDMLASVDGKDRRNVTVREVLDSAKSKVDSSPTGRRWPRACRPPSAPPTAPSGSIPKPSRSCAPPTSSPGSIPGISSLPNGQRTRQS